MSDAPLKLPPALFQTEWEEATIRKLYRHMRIAYRSHSNSVRVMALQQSLEDIPPSLGEKALLENLEKKLSL